jgi:hypothetical protein
MTNAPASIILIPVPVPAAGSPKVVRQVKPTYPAKRCDQRWPLNQQIPKYTPDPAQIEAIRRAGKELLEATRRRG